MYRHFHSKVVVFQEGVEPPPRCDSCRMNMQAGRFIRHQRMAFCDKNTQMRCQRRDESIADKCLKETFIPTGEEEAECIEGVEVFKYLGRLLDQSDNNWQAVLCDIWKVR